MCSWLMFLRNVRVLVSQTGFFMFYPEPVPAPVCFFLPEPVPIPETILFPPIIVPPMDRIATDSILSEKLLNYNNFYFADVA